MKNLKLFNSVVMSSVILLVTPLTSHAVIYPSEEKDLACCRQDVCPTRDMSKGIPGATQTATFIGTRIGSSGELVTISARDPGYKSWLTNTVPKMPKEKRADAIKAASTYSRILVRCSSSASTEDNILERGKSFTCPPGDDMYFNQESPICPNPATGPHNKVGITRESRDEKQQEAEKNLLASQDRLEQLQKMQTEVQKRAATNKERFGKLNQKVLEKGKKATTIDIDNSLPELDFLGSESNFYDMPSLNVDNWAILGW